MVWSRGMYGYYSGGLGVYGKVCETMDMTIDQQVVMDEALVPHASRLRIGQTYKEYYAIASGAEPPKTKAIVRKMQISSDTTMPPLVAKGTRLQTSVKVDKPAKGKQHAKSSTAKGLTVLSEKLSDEDDDDDVQQSEHDEDIDDQKAKDKESFDPIVQTPSHVESSYDECNDDTSHGMNVGGDEGPDAEDDDNELYGLLNINLEGQDVQMIDVHTTQVLKDTHVTLTLVNPDGQQQSSSVSSQFVSNMLSLSPDIRIYSLFELTPRVDVLVMNIVELLLLTALTLPLLSIPIISKVQQASAPSPVTAPSISLQDLPNFGSFFRFDHRVKTLEANFFEFMQTNQFAKAVSSIPDIVDRYLDHQMNEAVKIIKEQVKEQLKVQVSKILPNIKKTVNEQLEAKVLTRTSNSSKTSYAVAADLSELELKKILIEKMESNKCQDDEDKDEEPSAGSDRGSKRRRAGKEPESISAPKEKASKTSGKSTEGSKSHQKTSTESTPAEEPMQTTQDLEDPVHLEFETATHGRIQPWISDLAKQADSHTSFNELMDTPVDFSAFLMNRLKVDTLTLELLVGLTYELMKGSCKSLVELEFFLEEVYKAITDKLDWNNPEGQQYPHDLLKPLPLIPNSRGRRVIHFDHFINNDLEYLRGGASSRKYTNSITNTKATDYGHIKWIEDLVPRTMWSQVPVNYDKYAPWGISHWGREHQKFYGFAVKQGI
uniref:Uncharacterized protein n=1 Tax=Tanacetum cinerariifolium TaxID=118510 RepID=A0A6L2K1A0_TANCI|nr:hypothetical protein [Tanacetum cinerariifolium]